MPDSNHPLKSELSKLRQELLDRRNAVGDNGAYALITRVVNLIDLSQELSYLEIEEIRMEFKAVLKGIEKYLPEMISKAVQMDLDRRFSEAAGNESGNPLAT